MLEWVKQWEPGLEILEPRLWVARLEGQEGEKREHPARKLLGLWKAAYASGKKEKKVLRFEMENTLRMAPVLGDVRPIDIAFFEKIWK